ncbi:MAG: small subunit ribosomal protein S1, partial [Patiriisocius sp.]
MADKANKEVAEKAAKVKVEEVATEVVAEVSAEAVEAAAVVEEAATPQKPERELSLKESNPDKFLTDFNWHNYEEGIDPIDDGKLDEFEQLVKDNFVDTIDNEVVQGEVVFLSDRDAIIDINAKSEGVISLNEFRYNPDLKVGDKVEVLIDVREDSTGQLILSHRKARTIMAWDRVNKAHDEATIVNGFVKCRTKGGMIV